MLIQIICLVIGILGFVKGRINVSAKRELRGKGMYIVATLFCLPLPLSFFIGVLIGVAHAANGTPIDNSALLAVGVACTWLPVILAIVLAFSMSKPKEAAAPVVGGFPVMPPAPRGPEDPAGPPRA